jgi:hypothetical protein
MAILLFCSCLAYLAGCVCESGFVENENRTGKHLQGSCTVYSSVGHVEISVPIRSIESIEHFGGIAFSEYLTVGVKEGINDTKDNY